MEKLQFYDHLDITTTMIFFTVFLVALYILMRPQKPPPGPWLTLPIIGNMFCFLGRDPLVVFNEMRGRYGDVFSLYIENQLMVVLNGYDKVREALVKKGRVFSDRPKNYLSQHISKNRGIVFVSGNFWQEQRKFTLQAFKGSAFIRQNLEENILNEATSLNAFLQRYIGQDIDLNIHFKTCAFNLILKAVCDLRYEYDDERPRWYTDNLFEFLSLIGTTGPLANMLPFVKYLPGDLLQSKKADELTKQRNEYLFEFYKQHADTLDPEKPRDFTDLYLLETRNKPASESLEQWLYLVADLIGAGTDTTSSTLGWAILHLLEHPCVQRKVQNEIRNMIGQNRMPSLDDQSKMPYVEATIMEVFRHSHPVPLSVPHATSDHVEFQGYNIPKGSVVAVNLHSIFHDPRTWENPEEFRPERFLNKDGSTIKRSDFIPFSIGKRICPGETMARANIFLLLTSLCQNFSICIPEGEPLKGTSGVLDFSYHPSPFKVKLQQGQLPEC